MRNPRENLFVRVKTMLDGRADKNSHSFPLVLPLCVGLLNLLAVSSRAGEWSGYLAVESRIFPRTPLAAEQHKGNLSFSSQPEFYHEWAGGDQSLLIVPFLRLDQHDDERTHFDIRELFWQKVAESWELRIGLRKVFWGVTESQHLVDIINQTDLVENPDGEDKLGQPMVNFSWIRNWGTIDVFLLPGFRKRTFPGNRGRLRFPLRVDTDQAVYESGAENRHIDWAVRWFHIVGDWDIGVSNFYGTSREPLLFPGVDGSGDPVLIPRHDIIHQTSLDLQATKGGWLWKLEVLSRSGQDDRFNAFVGGFEYTFVNVWESGADLGILAEYHYDDRGDAATTPFEDDLFLGARLALNDPQSTDLLAGVIIDRENGGSAVFIETSRRMGESWKLIIEGRGFFGAPATDPLHAFRKDSYFQVEFARFF